MKKINFLVFFSVLALGIGLFPWEAKSESQCLDIDLNGVINEIDCGAPENETCELCKSGTEESLEEFPGEDLDAEEVKDIIYGIAEWMISVAGAVMVIFIVWAGLRLMAARGNPEAFTKARKNFVQVLIGALVILGVGVIINTVYYIATREFFGSYNQ